MDNTTNDKRINCCPICGRYPSEVRVKSIKEYGVEIKCNSCRIRTDMCRTEDEAIKLWNALTNRLIWSQMPYEGEGDK